MMSVHASSPGSAPLPLPDPPGAQVGRDPSTLLVALLAVLTVCVLELMRASGPFVDHAFAVAKLPGAVGAGLLTYAAPGLVVPMLLVAGRRRTGAAVIAGVGLLAALRLVAPALDGRTKLYVGLSAVAVGIAVLVLTVTLLAAIAGGRTVAGAIGAGAAGSVGLQLALGTWDAFWRTDAIGWTVSGALVAAMVGLAVAVVRDGVPNPTHVPRRLWVLGPLLSLLLMVLANTAFATSQSGAALAVAGPVLGVGMVVAAWIAPRAQAPRLVLLLGPAVLVGSVMVLGTTTVFDGVPVVMALLVLMILLLAQLAVLTSVAAVLDSGTRPVSSPRLAGVASVIGLSAILPVMLYQVAYEVPLGFPNEWVITAAAAVLGLGTLGARRHAVRVTGPVLPVVAAAALLLAGSSIAAVQAVSVPDRSPDGASGTGVVMVWNIHYAVDGTGALNPEAIAEVVDAYDPDVLLVNELSPGWVLAGGLDAGTWLSQRLHRQVAYGPAADRQFGSGVLSRWRIDDAAVHDLPQGSGSQERSALSARVLVGDEPLDVVVAQLQNKAANAATRVQQAEALVGAIDDVAGGDPVIVGGDFNANPDTEAIATITDSGFVSALDSLGLGDALTYPSSDPEQRLDWLLGRDVTFAEAQVLDQVRAADHLPLLVTVRH